MSTSASVALVFLIIPALFAGLVFLALSGALVYGMYKLRGVVKRGLLKLQALTARIYSIVRAINDKITAPFLWAHAANANVRAAAGGARRRVRYHFKA